MYSTLKRMVAVDKTETTVVRTHAHGEGRSHKLTGMME